MHKVERKRQREGSMERSSSKRDGGYKQCDSSYLVRSER